MLLYAIIFIITFCHKDTIYCNLETFHVCDLLCLTAVKEMK